MTQDWLPRRSRSAAPLWPGTLPQADELEGFVNGAIRHPFPLSSAEAHRSKHPTCVNRALFSQSKPNTVPSPG